MITNDDIMQILNLIATVPSLIGTFLMSYMCLKSISNNTSIKLILGLGISDFVYSLCNLMGIIGYDQGTLACTLEGVFREFSVKLSICFATSIGVLHYKIIEASPDFNKTRFLITHFSIGLIISLSNALR